MTHNLTIRHKIEIPKHRIIGTLARTFYTWFPFEDQEKLS